jgi:hypothetical protein
MLHLHSRVLGRQMRRLMQPVMRELKKKHKKKAFSSFLVLA